jgi:hypothetical protein
MCVWILSIALLLFNKHVFGYCILSPSSSKILLSRAPQIDLVHVFFYHHQLNIIYAYSPNTTVKANISDTY